MSASGDEPIILNKLNTVDLRVTNDLTVKNLSVTKSTQLCILDESNTIDYTEDTLVVKGKSQFLGNSLILDNSGQQVPKLLHIKNSNGIDSHAIFIEEGKSELNPNNLLPIPDEALIVENQNGPIANFIGAGNTKVSR